MAEIEDVQPRKLAVRGAHLAGFIVVTLSVGVAGAWVTQGAIDTWYADLDKPAWTPPDWLFGPAWTTLYILMAIAAWLVWDSAGWRQARVAFILYATQLVLNGAWSWIFFGARAPGFALAELVLLLAAIVATAWAFRRHRAAATWLMVPYIAWVVFAGSLNLAVWLMN